MLLINKPPGQSNICHFSSLPQALCLPQTLSLSHTHTVFKSEQASFPDCFVWPNETFGPLKTWDYVGSSLVGKPSSSQCLGGFKTKLGVVMVYIRKLMNVYYIVLNAFRRLVGNTTDF